MSYETVSVRMNRSDSSIRWGFILSSSGNKIIIKTVEPGSLSEKAGLRNGDLVESIGGRQTLSLSLQEANDIVTQACYEVCFTLQRYVTSHSCLPWTLSEKDNKLVVDEIQPNFGYIHNSYNLTQQGLPTGSSKTTSNYSSNQKYSSSATLNNSSCNNFSSAGFPSVHNTCNQNQYSQAELKQSSAPLSSRYNLSNYTTGTTFTPNSTLHNSPNNRNQALVSSTSSNRNSVKFTDNTFDKNSYPRNNFAEAKNQSYDPPAPGITTKSSPLPLNQQTTIQTSFPSSNGFRCGSRSQSSLSPGGSRVRFHSPSSRTGRDLSPNSSIEHLQYNSPMNLYSSDAVAEQYTMQTGRALEGQRSQNNTPAYLNSETKKYIEEVEGRMRRGLSPSCQSSSFKRISQAVGAPCK
ncbi:unnamed protein product [Auanema sp. JU1783]|nr:unnamed protein product [Auanema sp. JU1783]